MRIGTSEFSLLPLLRSGDYIQIMSFQTPSFGSTLAFLLIVFFVLFSLVGGLYFSCRRLGLPAGKRTFQFGSGLLAWLGLASAFVASGIMDTRPFPLLPLFFLTINLAALALAFSPVGAWFARGLSLPWLVAFQGFRLPLEFVLHSWAEQGSIPLSMTWNGANFDVVSGILALVLAPFARNKALAWVANGAGVLLLLNVMRVAIFSSPLPFAWPVEPQLLLAFHLPYAWIGVVCVAGALFGHVVLTRALLSRVTR